MNLWDIYEKLCEYGVEPYKGQLVLPFLAEGEEEDSQVINQILQQVAKDYPHIRQAVVKYNGKTYMCVKGHPVNELQEGFFMKLVAATLLMAAGGWIGYKLLSRKRKKTLKVMRVDKAKKRILVDFEGQKQWLSPTEFHNLDPQPKTGTKPEAAVESLVGQDLPYLPFMPLFMREDCSGWTALPAGAEMTVVAEDKSKLTVDVDGEDYFIPRGKALDAKLDHVKSTYKAEDQKRRWGWTKEERVKLAKRLVRSGNTIERLCTIGQTTPESAQRYLDWLSEDFETGLVKGLMAQDDPRFKNKKSPERKPPERKPVEPQNRDRKIVKKANGTNKDKAFYRPLGGEGEAVEQGPFDPDWPTPGKQGRGAGWQDLPKAWALHFEPEDLPEMKCGCPGPGSCIDNPKCPCPEECPCKQPIEAISESAAVNYYYWYARYHEPSSHYTSAETSDEHVTEAIVDHIMAHGAQGVLTEFYGPLGNALVRLGSNEPGRFDKRSRYYRQFEKHFRSAYKKVYREQAPDHVLRRVFREWMNRGKNATSRGNLRSFVRSRTQGMPGPSIMGITRG